MKKIISLLLVFSLLICLTACKKEEATPPTCEELIAAYEQAGYHVSHHENEYKDESTDEICYVKVWLEDVYECVYFYFYETAETAESLELNYNIFVYMFSIIYGDPTWVWTDTYGNIGYEYEDGNMLKPFKELIKEK